MLGEDTVSTDEEDLKLRDFSEWSTLNIETLPVAVAYPKQNCEDVYETQNSYG